MRGEFFWEIPGFQDFLFVLVVLYSMKLVIIKLTQEECVFTCENLVIYGSKSLTILTRLRTYLNVGHVPCKSWSFKLHNIPCLERVGILFIHSTRMNMKKQCSRN